MIGRMNREAMAAFSRGRQLMERVRDVLGSREAAEGLDCCRRFAAGARDADGICGLTPAAKCCRGYAAGNAVAATPLEMLSRLRRWKCDRGYAAGEWMTSTPPLSIALFLVAAVLGAVGQFLYKSGADRATGGMAGYLFNVRLLLGVLCYGAVMVLFVAAFKSGGSLAVLYPVYASTFIFAAIIARFANGHPILPIHVLGWGLLIGGMSLMGWQTSSTETLDPTTSQPHVEMGSQLRTCW